MSESGLTVGIWSELADRFRRLLRDRDRSLLQSQHRLQDFLSALQASPNGVMLLDCDARIEWCNHISAAHFGLDTRRDVAQAIGNLVRDPGFVRYLSSRDYQHGMTMQGVKALLPDRSCCRSNCIPMVRAACCCYRVTLLC